MVGGAIIATVSTANAADLTPSATATASADDDTRGGGGGETALTGDALAKVKAAVAAEYPGASFDRVETDNGGDYEAHITTAAGDQVTVELDDAYAITGTGEHDGRGGHHGGGGGGGETALTGDALAKVKAAVTAEYPGASFDRVETDHDGAYEAHITTAGDRVTVELDQAYAITGTE